MTDTTPRHLLPLLAAGQAQKEITHNEALMLIDMLIAGTVDGVGVNTPPDTRSIGQAWIVGPSPTADWVGHQHRLVAWMPGGWRSLALPPGAAVRDASGKLWLRGDSGWAGPATVAAPEGGGTVDTQARTAIAALCDGLRRYGMITE